MLCQHYKLQLISEKGGDTWDIDDISNILGLCLQLPTYYLFADAEHALLMAVKVMAKWQARRQSTHRLSVSSHTNVLKEKQKWW